MKKNLAIGNNLREELQEVTLLYAFLEEGLSIDKNLSGSHRFLKETIHRKNNIYWVCKKDKYQPTLQGELYWELWRSRWWDFNINYDIYAGVDLEKGAFAHSEDNLEKVDEKKQLIWEDLRIAVCMRKIQLLQAANKKTYLNPFIFAFFTQLSQGYIIKNEQWQMDIAFDSIFWTEIENMVNLNIWPQELAYENISYEQVIDDIIEKGILEAKKRWEKSNYYDGLLVGTQEIEPSHCFENEQEVKEEYASILNKGEQNLQRYHYEPYWNWRHNMFTAGFVGACWMV